MTHLVSAEENELTLRRFTIDGEITRQYRRFNAAKLGLAKLCLNSKWRKLTENPRKTRVILISDPQELYRFLATSGFEVTNLLFAGNEVLWIS